MEAETSACALLACRRARSTSSINGSRIGCKGSSLTNWPGTRRRRERRRAARLPAIGLSPAGLFLLGGGEEYQRFQFFCDVVKVVLTQGLDENQRTGLHLLVLGADLHVRAAADDVVELIFAMRFLQIGGPGR